MTDARQRAAGLEGEELTAEALVGLRLHGGPDRRAGPGQQRLPAHPDPVVGQFHAAAQRTTIDQQQIDLAAVAAQIVPRRTDQGAVLDAESAART